MSIDTDYATLRSVLHTYEPKHWAIEFGVYSGYSLAIIAEHMPVIGLDSFQGLPEEWREGFPKGAFHDGWSSADLQGSNRMIIPGWFEHTVPVLIERGIPPLGLVHIDCDLYSSTVTALDAVTHSIDEGTIIVFDEYHSYPGAHEHEAKAFAEWCERYQLGVDLLSKGTGEHAQEAAFVIRDMGVL